MVFGKRSSRGDFIGILKKSLGSCIFENMVVTDVEPGEHENALGCWCLSDLRIGF